MHRQIARSAIRPIRNLQGQSSAQLGKWALRAVLVLAALLLASSWLTFRTSAEAGMAQQWEAQSRNVLALTSELRMAAVFTIRGERGFLLTRDETFLEPYYDGRERIRATMQRLVNTLDTTEAQQERVALLQGRIDHHLGLMATLIEFERRGQHQRAIERIQSGEGRHSLEAIMVEIDKIEEFENRLLRDRAKHAAEAAAREDLFEYLLGLVGALLMAMGILASIALRGSAARETAAAAELRRFATTDELTGAELSTTDV